MSDIVKYSEFHEIKRKGLVSIKWAGLTEIILRSVQPIISLILARLLTPKEFGIISIAMIVVGFSQIFQDLGLSKTLVQRERDIESSADIVFWTNFVLSVFIYIIIFASAPLVVGFFKEPASMNVLRVLCLQIPLASFISVHQALYKRSFQFKELFLIRFISVVISGILSIVLVVYGFGVWALVYGALLDSFIQIILFWGFSLWHPSFHYDMVLAGKLLGFSIWILLEAVLSWLMVWGDSAAIGHFIGVKELGVYSVGVMFLSVVSGFFCNPIFAVAYSTFSRLQSALDQLRDYFIEVTQLLATFAFPMGVCIVLLAKPISNVLFGSKWQGIEIVLMIIVIKDTLTSVGSINFEVLRAIGKPNVNVSIFFLSALFFVPLYIFAAPYGMLIFCFARVLVGIFAITLSILAIRKFLGIYFNNLIVATRNELIAAFVMGVTIFLLSRFVLINTWYSILITIIVGYAAYSVVLWLLDRDRFMLKLKYAYTAIVS